MTGNNIGLCGILSGRSIKKGLLGKVFSTRVGVLCVSIGCANQPPSLHEGLPSATVHTHEHERLPILVSNSVDAEKYAGKVVHVYGRTIASNYLGWSTPALELETGGIVVLQPKPGASLDELRRVMEARPGGRFMVVGGIQMLPPKESQREFAIMTLEGVPQFAVATYDEVKVGLWPASTPTSIAVAPMFFVPLSGTAYTWWSLNQNAEGTLFLEADAFGSRAITLEEPIETVNEVLPLDADGDSLFELVLSLTTKSGKKRAIVVGFGGGRIAALEAKIGAATTADEIFKALGTYNWTPVLGGPDGANVARVLWDTATMGNPPHVNLRMSGMRFYTAEDIMMKGDVRPDRAMLRLRADNGQVVVDARCGDGWKSAEKQDVPAAASKLAVALTAARRVVDKKWNDVTKVCMQ